MINITKEQKTYLREQGVPFEDALEKDDLEALLEVFDDAVVDHIVTHNDEPDEIGIRLQRIYDEIRFIHNAEE